MIFKNSTRPLLLAVLGASLVQLSVAESQVDAIYSVPSATPDLAQAAEYPARSDQSSYGSPEVLGLVRFALPDELTGIDSMFELVRKADGKWDGTGTDGSKMTGTCAAEGKDWFACLIKFENLLIDRPMRDLIITQRFGTGFEAEQRLAVARLFEGQPLGKIKLQIGRP